MQEHPIGGVISMLQDLMVEARQEAATEESNFQKFTYWCKTSARKLQRAIDKEKDRIARFTAEIDGLKKEVETLNFDIDTLTNQIEAQESNQVKARTKLRNETYLYDDTTKALLDTMYAIEDAVVVMTKAEEAGIAETNLEVEDLDVENAEEGNKKLAKAQGVASVDWKDSPKMFLGLKHKVKKQSVMGQKWMPPPAEAENDESNAVNRELEAMAAVTDSVAAASASKWNQGRKGKLASSVASLVTATKGLRKVALKAMSNKTGKLHKALPKEFQHINLNPGAKNPFKKKGAVKVYHEHEGAVIETFKDLDGELGFDKIKTTESFMARKNQYELAKKSRDMAVKAAKENKREKQDIDADRSAELAAIEVSLAAEQSELAADTATMEATDQECKTANGEWEERTAVREGEMKAMEMAVKILSKVTGVRNPDTHEIPKKEFLFLQIASVPSGIKDTKAKAVALLREVGKKAHNGKMEMLANSIMAFDGPFDKMKAMVQKMIFRLQAEQQDEDNHKNWCDAELQKNDESTADKTEKIKLTKIDIEEMDAKLKTATKAIVENNEKLEEATTYMEQETTLREENKAEIKRIIEDSQAAIEAVNQATGVLKDFYKESGMIAKEPWEFVQISKKSNSHGVTLPESPDTWDSSYTGVADPQEGGNGVLAILEGVATKFAKMESDATLQETTDQKNYDKDMAAKKVEIADIKSDTAMKEQTKQSLQQKLDASSSKLKHETSENDAIVQYLKDLEGACAPGEGSYEDRKKARLDEIAALRKAQTILEDAFRAK
jgi:predicted  nucleic acid-binding Zn-ribbon protein